MLARSPTIPGPRAHGPEALGGDHEVLPPPRQPPTHDLLGAPDGVERAAQRVDVRRVEEGDAARRRAIEDSGRRRLIALQPEGHRAETEARHAETGAAEADVAHGTQRVTGMVAIGKWANSRMVLLRSGEREAKNGREIVATAD